MQSNSSQELEIITITNDGAGESFFSERKITLNGDENRRLSNQISAINFRLRTSGNEYASDWHVAGDPTLLIMLQGEMQIELRNGKKKTFAPGEMFIAEDFLQKELEFDHLKHGHRAQVISPKGVQVLHLKLEKLC